MLRCKNGQIQSLACNLFAVYVNVNYCRVFPIPFPHHEVPMKLLLPEDKKPVHVTTMPIRWGDMDALGHINNTVYFRYFEEARVRWLTEGGRSMVESGEGPVVVNVFCNFFSQVEYPGDLLIRQYISNVGRSSCDVWMTMERTDQPGRIVADGGCTMVWVNYAAQKSVRLPQWVLELLNQALPEEQPA